MADKTKSIDKTSFLYQILEDVYNASSLCRPDIEQYQTTILQSQSSYTNTKSNAISKKKTPQITIKGISAPTTLKNYHIKSSKSSYSTKFYPPFMLQSARRHHNKSSKNTHKKQRPQRPSTARLRTRAYYKNTKSIEAKCESNNAKRPHSARQINCRSSKSSPTSAPLKKSQSESKLNNKYSSKKHYKSTTSVFKLRFTCSNFNSLKWNLRSENLIIKWAFL